MEPGEMGQTLKIGSLYFRSSHVRRILILVVIVLILLYWFVLPANRKASSKSFPVPALVMSDFEPLKIPAGFHYNIDTSKSSLKLENRQFVLKGKPLTILSGAMHYFRVPRDYWRDRMLKMKACGLNTLETYVAWNRHEEIRDQFSFEGNLDLRSYIQLAHELGLYVILRPGPYICAEWDLGGLPSWLLRDPQMKLRSNYPPYMDAVRKYFNKLLPTVVDLQYNKGGPIIMVQVENEFGSYSEEVEHMEFLAKLLASNGITELLFTSDNKDGIQKKTLNTALRTGNFQKFVEGELLLDVLVRTGTKEPLMIMEFWTGWFDHWGKEHQVVGTERIVESLQLILKQKSSINLYMFHGGTNFGFFAGANHFNKYKSDVTSYDYGAPLSEAGDTTRKFSMMQEMLLETVLKPQLGISTLPEPPSNSAKAAYGDVEIDSFLGWNDLLKTVTPVNSEQIISMEMLDINNGGGQGYGYIVYRRTLTKGGSLTFGNVYDRAQVLMNGLEVSVFDWGNSSNKLHLPDAVPPCVLDIMVENRGRVNYATFQGEHLNDQRKGLKDDVFLSGMKLTDWQIYPLQFNKEMLESIERGPWKPFVIQRNSPTMYKATLKITDKPKDTFVNMKLWKKGVVFVNGFNLGRYWHLGPQQTLYLPAPVLRKGDNTVLVFEEEIPGPAVSFSSVPVLG